MTIIFEMGDQFWIESFDVNVTIEDAAGSYNNSAGNIPFERAGTYLGAAIVLGSLVNNDNTQAIGAVEINNIGFINLAIGNQMTGIRLVVTKTAGTAGSTVMTYSVIVFLRRPAK